MGPYRSHEKVAPGREAPWPLPMLVIAALVAWWFVEHALGSILGR